MNRKRLLIRSLVICGVLALILGVLGGRTFAQLTVGNASYETIDTYVEEQMQRLNIPGVSLAIVEGDQIVHLRGFGQARPNGGAPSPQTPFILGSTTKSFTALAVMQLVEAGKIELDSPLQRYLSWFRVADSQASAQITVRHLLSQISGLPGAPGMITLANLDDSPGAAERQARALSTLKLTRPVGAAFEYSNLNYNLLGLVVAAASGESYADYIQNHIFAPLEMRHSYTAQTMAKQNGLAVGHRYWFTFPQAMPNLVFPQGSLPTGGLISSAEDMAHYLIAHLNGGRHGEAQILSPEGIAELHRGRVAAVEMGVAMGQYGMGWFITEFDQTKTVWHHGALPDFSSYMALLPAQQKGLVILINADHYGFPPIVTEVGEGATALLAGRQPSPLELGFAPWVMRALLLIPFLQIIGVGATLRRLHRWRQDPQLRPSKGRIWGLHILLPLLPNLLLATITVLLLVSGLIRFTLLFTPDLSWVALICGGFAGIWTFLRTGLILRILRKPEASKRALDGSEHIH
ncbi:MAG: serine hydrolase domain-containing protein [Leptolyngbyaceae cyanobacterium MO_188.B28]|nr:serine hydrolase domain-containing protein [Leptolyngbyaceae cyanobacterium MO_188.B28]